MLTSVIRRRILARKFSQFTETGINSERAAQDRVVSTPQWPVPYYVRKFRTTPVKTVNDPDFYFFGVEISDMNAIETRDMLARTPSGRVVLENV